MSDAVSDLLTEPEVAARFRRSPAAVRSMRRSGAGPRAIRVGKRVMYRVADVEAWLASRPEAGGQATAHPGAGAQV